ncbi:MAG TPA: 4a-hydroxytetrahydrobiopterin dehydratase [Pyrinomonadaceae bacterium]|nr:4a-hydroxytetrahydrobiopterin dehydratase [Pyrinomonadaceae bacterium]
MERRKLDPEEIRSKLSESEGWKFEDDKIVKKFKFSNFAEALVFVNKVGEIAEDADHHPDIQFGWGYAEVATTTHDRGGVTDHDLDLAESIDLITVAPN